MYYKRTNKSKVQNLSPHTEHSKERLCPSIAVIMSKDSTVDRLQTEASWGNSSGGSTPQAGFPTDPVPNSGESPVDQQWHYIKAQKTKLETLEIFHHMTKHKAYM